MKNTKALLPSLFLAILTLSACGKVKLKSDRVPYAGSKGVKIGQPLTPAQFQSLCASFPGQMLNNNTICRHEAFRKEISTGSSDINEVSDAFLVDVLEGSVVETQGSVTSNAVEVTLNNNRIMGVPQTYAVPNSGRLGFRFSPGRTYGVRLFVYTCINQNQVPVRCPF